MLQDVLSKETWRLQRKMAASSALHAVRFLAFPPWFPPVPLRRLTALLWK
jgi:hypothetical protein